MSTENHDDLTKILAELSSDDYPEGPSGESFWAQPLGDDLCELRNVPFHAYDLHFADVVRALPEAPDRSVG